MNTFVTFDLDYWTLTEPFNSAHLDYLQSIIDISKVTRIVSLHHHVVTRNMIPKDTDEVINIDFHNDIVDECPREYLNEGTWGNFLPKATKQFTWVYPDEEQCINDSRGICCGANTNQPEIYCVKYKTKYRYNNLKLMNKNINKFVICISQHWAEYDVTPYLNFISSYRHHK
jgi:hypothetical protein